jgi:hypothetical protein
MRISTLRLPGPELRRPRFYAQAVTPASTGRNKTCGFGPAGTRREGRSKLCVAAVFSALCYAEETMLASERTQHTPDEPSGSGCNTPGLASNFTEYGLFRAAGGHVGRDQSKTRWDKLETGAFVFGIAAARVPFFNLGVRIPESLLPACRSLEQRRSSD